LPIQNLASVPDLVDLLERMTIIPPSERPSFADVLAEFTEIQRTTSDETMAESVPLSDYSHWASHIKEEK
jgi:hypothetical protein